MSLMGTLAKVAIGYAAARGVDRLAGGQGLAGLFGGAQVPQDEAEADHAPGIGNMQDIMAQMTGGAGLGQVQDMIAKFTGGAGGFDLSALMGGGKGGGDASGLLSSMPGGGAGLAGIFAAMGGAAAMGGQGTAAMLDQIARQGAAPPQAEETAALMLRAMIQAAKADGEIDDAEQARIIDTLGENADADDIAFVEDRLGAPVDVAALAADTPAPMAMQVYAMSLMPIRVDTDGEARYLDQLAGALGLNQETVNALHLQMGVKPLYA